MTRRRRVRAVGGGAAVLAALGLLGAGATGAAAHPFGDPQTVTLSADGTTVRVRWAAPPDDLLLLGGFVGALPERREIVFDVRPGAAPEPVGVTDAERLAGSPELAGYLADRIVVRQQGVACPVEVRLDGIVDTGAVLVFTCPRTVEEVDVAVTLLTDLHPAYRTVALGRGSTPDRALYTVHDTELVWRFEAGGGVATRGWSAARDGWWWPVAGAGTVLGGVVLAWRGRRRIRYGWRRLRARRSVR